MTERGILIADKDTEIRKQVAEIFIAAGYQVETTDSAVQVLCNVMEKQTPVVLLGTDFDKRITSADLIQLLKKCNRRLAIILVSDEVSLAVVRKIRQEGIFYHTLKPQTEKDKEEILQAVECAFDNTLKTA